MLAMPAPMCEKTEIRMVAEAPGIWPPAYVTPLHPCNLQGAQAWIAASNTQAPPKSLWLRAGGKCGITVVHFLCGLTWDFRIFYSEAVRACLGRNP
jgi:hypothetical protein